MLAVCSGVCWLFPEDRTTLQRWSRIWPLLLLCPTAHLQLLLICDELLHEGAIGPDDPPLGITQLERCVQRKALGRHQVRYHHRRASRDALMRLRACVRALSVFKRVSQGHMRM